MFRLVCCVLVIVALLVLPAQTMPGMQVVIGGGDGPRRPQDSAYERLTPLPTDVAERLLTLYDAGDYQTFDSAVSQLKGRSNWLHLEQAAKRWIDASPARERRRLVSAAVALEVASAQRSSWPLSAPFIEVGCQLLREQDPSPAERQWHLAAMAFLVTFGEHSFLVDPAPAKLSGVDEAAARGGEYEFERKRERELRQERLEAERDRMEPRSRYRAHMRHATRRFPGDLAFTAAEATILEYREASWLDLDVIWLDADEVARLVRRGRSAIAGVPAHARMTRESASQLLAHEWELTAARRSITLWDLIDRFEPQLASEALAPDGHLRRGAIYLRLAQWTRGLEELALANEKAQTPFVRYLARFIAAHAMERLGEVEGATHLFRAALEAVPRAQSATFGLAPLLARTDPDAAAALMAQAVAEPLVVDPVRHYSAEPEQWPLEIARLRSMLR